MKVVWAGTFEPEFSRNRKLARLLQLAGIQTVVVREQMWGDDRIELASRGRVRVALRGLLRYPRLLFRLHVHSQITPTGTACLPLRLPP